MRTGGRSGVKIKTEGSRVTVGRKGEKYYSEYGTYTTPEGVTKRFKKTIPYEKAVEIGRVKTTKPKQIVTPTKTRMIKPTKVTTTSLKDLTEPMQVTPTTDLMKGISPVSSRRGAVRTGFGQGLLVGMAMGIRKKRKKKR